jgi:hypothetical protein
MTTQTCDLKTSIVYNNSSKLVGLPPLYYRYRKCNTNLNGNTPAEQYQKLKLIQKTVRVESSLYTSNLGALNAYKQPTTLTHGVCWNQMSDRPFPSVQTGIIPTGTNSSMNKKHSSVTSSRPGCQAPGGIGCDIKHNSYERYLNRLKGKGPLRRGIIPTTFGAQIPFNPAFPIYGGKITKTNIINGCNCPIENNNLSQNIKIYNNPLWQNEPLGKCGFNIGDFVYAFQTGNTFFTRAIIIDFVEGIYKIKFDNNFEQNAYAFELKIYFPCECNEIIPDAVNISSPDYNVECTFPLNLLL